MRGVGKTVLLNRFTRDARAQGYEVAYIEADDSGDFLERLAGELRRILLALDAGERVNEYAKRALQVLKSLALTFDLKDLTLALGINPAKGVGDTGKLDVDLTSLLIAIGEAAREADTAVLIAVDELQYVSESEFEALIMALHRATQQALPILAVATGLPQVLGLAGRAKTYAERLFDYRPLGALSEAEARDAIVAPAASERVKFEPTAIARLYELTGGYPFFVQEWAYSTWNAAERSPITRAVVDGIEARVLRELDEGFFLARYDRTTPSERRYMRGMAELGAGPCQSGDVADVLGVPASRVAPTRDLLIKKGMIYSPEYGKIAFTVPLFDGFMRRIEPKFERA